MSGFARGFHDNSCGGGSNSGDEEGSLQGSNLKLLSLETVS